MTDLFKVFNITSQKEFDNLMEKMDIDMFSTSSIFEIIDKNDDIDTCRKNILENVALNDYQNYHLLEEQFKKKPFKRTLKENQVLTEGIDEIVKYYPKLGKEKVQELVRLDPTYKGGNELGTYGKWILNLFNKFLKYKISQHNWLIQKTQGKNYPEPIQVSQDRWEDFDKLPNLLKQFDAIKNKAKLNIDNIKSVAELYSTIQNVTADNNVSADKEIQHLLDLVNQSVSKGAEIIYKTNSWIILIPKTFESSKVFGNDTNWCTTSSSGYYYNYYKNNYGGEYYINVDLQDKKLYQFHFESNQFMDSSDDQINMDEFSNEHPELVKFYETRLNEMHDTKGPIKDKIHNPKWLKNYFDTLTDFSVDNGYIRGKLKLEDIDTGYDARYDYKTFDDTSYKSLDIDDIKKILNGTYFEKLNFPADWGDISDYSEYKFDNAMKDYGITWEEMINWDENSDEEDDDNKISDEKKKKIYNMLMNNFYDNQGIEKFYEYCARTGTENNAYYYVKGQLCQNLPIDDEDDGGYDSSDESLYIAIPMTEVIDMLTKIVNNYNDEDEDDDKWYTAYYEGSGESSESWIYAWRIWNGFKAEYSIITPYEGWFELDEDYYYEALNDFIDRVKQILDGSEDINESKNYLKETEESFIADDAYDDQAEDDEIVMIPQEEAEAKMQELENCLAQEAKKEKPSNVYNITINYNKSNDDICESFLYGYYKQCKEKNGNLISENMDSRIKLVLNEWNNEFGPIKLGLSMKDKMKLLEASKSNSYIKKIINILDEYE